jgi:hypothetical protein
MDDRLVVNFKDNGPQSGESATRELRGGIRISVAKLHCVNGMLCNPMELSGRVLRHFLLLSIIQP